MRIKSLEGYHLEKYNFEENPEKVSEIGVNHAFEQSRELLSSGVPGIHFYTLNRSRATLAILEKLQG